MYNFQNINICNLEFSDTYRQFEHKKYCKILTVYNGGKYMYYYSVSLLIILLS